MSSSDFGRVPELDIAEETPKKEEEKIFDKPKENVSMKIKEPNSEDQKKIKLKEHLAKCRQKSIAVRKAKALEKKANKKPRGRPKKIKEEQPVVNMQSLPEPVVEQKLPSIEEGDMFKDLPKAENTPPVNNLDTIQNDVMEKEQPTPTPLPAPPIQHSTFNVDDLWSKMSSKIDEKFASVNTLSQVQTAPDHYAKYYEDMKANEERIRKDERERMKAEALQHKQNVLTGATNKYFNKLGYSTPERQTPKAPQVSENNAWDNLLNPRRKY